MGVLNEIQLEYRKKYREKNKEKIRSSSSIYRQENKKKIKITYYEYYQLNKEKINKTCKIYRDENIDYINKRAKKINNQRAGKLMDIYIINQLLKQGFTKDEIKSNSELIEVKRLIIKTKRLCKTLQTSEQV
jgi:hypothetical protein